VILEEIKLNFKVSLNIGFWNQRIQSNGCRISSRQKLATIS